MELSVIVLDLLCNASRGRDQFGIENAFMILEHLFPEKIISWRMMMMKIFQGVTHGYFFPHIVAFKYVISSPYPLLFNLYRSIFFPYPRFQYDAIPVLLFLSAFLIAIFFRRACSHNTKPRTREAIGIFFLGIKFTPSIFLLHVKMFYCHSVFILFLQWFQFIKYY